MLPQGSQCAAGRAERGAARVGEGSAPDRVVLERARLAAGAEVRVGRRFHGRHAGVIGVQVGVIHLIHGGQPVRAPGLRTRREEVGVRGAAGDFLPQETELRVGVCLRRVPGLKLALCRSPVSCVTKLLAFLVSL